MVIFLQILFKLLIQHLNCIYNFLKPICIMVIWMMNIVDKKTYLSFSNKNIYIVSNIQELAARTN